jgi:hypothetical protein
MLLQTLLLIYNAKHARNHVSNPLSSSLLYPNCVWKTLYFHLLQPLLLPNPRASYRRNNGG